MKDLLAQQKFMNEKFINEAEPPKPPAGGGGAPGGGEETEKKVKTDIPESPFEPDVSQIKDELKNLLKQWKIKNYMSDQHRSQEYYKDLMKLLNTLEGEK